MKLLPRGREHLLTFSSLLVQVPAYPRVEGEGIYIDWCIMTYSPSTLNQSGKFNCQLDCIQEKKAYVQKYRDIKLAYNVIKQYKLFTLPPKDINLALMLWHL